MSHLHNRVDDSRVYTISACFPVIQVACVLLISCLLVPQASSQTTSTIYGTVTDPSGAMLDGATIIATQSSTNLTRQVTTAADGTYTFVVLPVGPYSITASKQGFAKTLTTAELILNQNLQINFQLKLGTVSQMTEVTSQSGQVELQSAALGNVEVAKAINDLPLNGRNYLQLAQLQPGVNPPIPGTATLATPATPGGTNFSPQGNGVRPYDNLVLIDGTYNIEPSLNTVMSVPSPDSLEELKVYTSDSPIEFGSAGGVVTNVVTKSGTNSWHGSVYDFERNTVLNARNYFAPEREPIIGHQFGATIGGPIRKDRIFWQIGYQGTRDALQVASSAAVPSQLELDGNFTQSGSTVIDPVTGQPFPGNIIPQKRVNPVAAAIIHGGLFAPANTGANTWTGLLPSPTRGDQGIARVDAVLSSADSLAVRAIIEDFDVAQPIQPYALFGPIATPKFAVDDTARFQNYSITETHVFSPNLLNQAMFAYIRAGLAFNTEVDKVNARDYGFTFPVTFPFPAMPQIGVAGLNPIGLNDSAETLRTDNMFQLEDNISKTSGKHQLRFGVSFRRTQLNSYSPITFAGAFGFFGVFTGNPTADFLLGLPTEFFQGGGQDARYYRTTYFAPYAEDTIRVTRRFTVTLGLRYELFTPPTELEGREDTLVPGVQSTVHPDVPRGVLYPGDPGIPNGIYHLDKDNFAPQVGVAWDPTGSGRTSIRAAYGIFNSEPILYSNIDGTTAPKFWAIATGFGTHGTFADPWGGTSPFTGAPLPGVLPAGFGQNTAGWMPSVVTPYIQHWHLTMQHQLAENLTAQVSYVGTTGQHLVGFISPTQAKLFVPGIPNTPATIAERSPIPGILLSDNASTENSSNYNAVQASITKRYSRGLSFSAAYTFSRMIDDGSAANRFQVLPGAPLYPQCSSCPLEEERGLSNFNVPQRFVANVIWDISPHKQLSGAAGRILNGWQVNSIISVQSGRPFTVIDSTDPQATGEFFSRPNLIGNPNLSPGQRTPSKWFNTAAFQKIPFGTPMFGDEPRNIVYGPGFADVDFSVFKNMNINERVKGQFRVEFFNLFNRTNFQVPVNDISSPLFGVVLSTASPPRNIQLALKFSF
jgi:hypothetical protein